MAGCRQAAIIIRYSNGYVMNKKAGITLIEGMLYCAVLSWMASFFAILIFHYMRDLKGLTVRCSRMADVHLAFDTITRDISLAAPERVTWVMMDKDALLFKTTTDYVGWFCQDNTLVRYAGSYNTHTNSWGDHGKSLVLDAIQAINFTPVYDSNHPNVTAIRVYLKVSTQTQSLELEGIAYLLNGSTV
jgi:hypothetical protein